MGLRKRTRIAKQAPLEVLMAKLSTEEMQPLRAPGVVLKAAVIIGRVVLQVVAIHIIAFNQDRSSLKLSEVFAKVIKMQLRPDPGHRVEVLRARREASDQLVNRIGDDFEGQLQTS